VVFVSCDQNGHVITNTWNTRGTGIQDLEKALCRRSYCKIKFNKYYPMHNTKLVNERKLINKTESLTSY
jgi:hypothetical protein